MKRNFLMLLVMAVFCMFDVAAKDKGEYDVFLLIGQSNMAGRGYMIESDTLSNIEGVYILNKEGEVVPARNPLNQYSTVAKPYDMQQINPGLGFAQKMHAKTGRKILLVVNARGGTSVSEWAPGNEETKFFSEAVRRTKEAMKYGELKAVLWHQGCADSSPNKREVYLERLENMVSNLREQLGDKKLYFVAGELGPWRASSPDFNKMLQGIGDKIKYSDYVSSEGTVSRADDSDPHFSRESQIILGERYADKVLKYIYKK